MYKEENVFTNTGLFIKMQTMQMIHFDSPETTTQ